MFKLIVQSRTSEHRGKCKITCEGLVTASGEISTDPYENLITRTAFYVLRCHGYEELPFGTHIHINNQIPVGESLGGSGSAVVARVLLAKEVGLLKHLDLDRVFDFCLMIERHPDNVGPALFGGLVGSFLWQSPVDASSFIGIPSSESTTSDKVSSSGGTPSLPPHNLAHHMQYPLGKQIKAIAIIPDFQVPTSEARAVLPANYPRNDVTFNHQRAALLPVALGQTPLDPELIHLAMQDRLHQSFRQQLIPGFDFVVDQMSPKTFPGFLGICIAGAGPTFLALATENFEAIAQEIMSKLKMANEDMYSRCTWRFLEPSEGASVNRIVDKLAMVGNR